MRGLLAVECLYHQIVDGIKTQTRRSGGLEVVNDWPDEWNIAAAGLRPYPHNQIRSVLFIRKGIKTGEMTDADSVILKPRYKIGEVLYLKEPTMQAFGITKYRYSEYEAFNFFRNLDMPLQTVTKKWGNKLFMPASAARAFIKITGIRCERLLDISDQDCISEGIESASVRVLDERFTGYKNYLRSKNGGRDMLHSCEYYAEMFPHRPDLSAKRKSFLSLYKFANKVKEVENIWCWVYEFEYLPNYKINASE